MPTRFQLLAAAVLGGLACVASASAQEQVPTAADPLPPAHEWLDAAQWTTEQVELSDGRKLKGLIQSEDAKELVFVEIHQPTGKPMYGLVRHLSRDRVKATHRLEREERETLVRRLDKFRRRFLIEAGRVENVVLQTTTHNGATEQNYAGEWFNLRSAADEETTRRAIVRIEQMFMAYRGVLPPRFQPQRKLNIVLFGSTDDYARFLQSSGLRFENPSFYLTDQNLIVAGSELSKYARELAKKRAEYAAVRREYQQYESQLPELLNQLNGELAQQAVGDDERKGIVNATRRRWSEERAAKEKKIVEAERQCDAQFNTVTERMFERLAHEAFHAYLENYVYPQAKYAVPRWLNEGLAQVFEQGMLEADTLRLDAPRPDHVAALQADLRGPKPLSLADVLRADERSFLVEHPNGRVSSRRHYLYSWGLAFYLAFRRPTFEIAALDRYVDLKSKDLDPVRRFETLAGMPLAEFEAAWRQDMLSIKVPARATESSAR